MSARPRRTAAQRATAAITDMADRDRDSERSTERNTMSSRSRRGAETKGTASISRGPPSSSPTRGSADNSNLHLNIKLPSNKLRQATAGSSSKSGSSATAGGREPTRRAAARVPKKSYVVDSDSDEDDEDDEEQEDIQVGDMSPRTARLADDDDDDDEDNDVDAEGEADDDEMEVDAEGDSDDDMDADGDVDMDVPPPTIKVSKPAKAAASSRKSHQNATAAPKQALARTNARLVVDDEDDELSELDSEQEDDMNDTVELGGAELDEEDAEGDDDDMDAEGEVDVEIGAPDVAMDSEEGDGLAELPDITRMTARQRAKMGDVSHEYMKLSDEVQAKKHFTAEELSMRRAEMARRRRNLSEKRNEEVKMETINKLLKKQAPKTNRKAALAGDETPAEADQRANPLFVRWVSTKEGSRLGVPDEWLVSPAGEPLGAGGGRGGLAGGKLVQEVA